MSISGVELIPVPGVRNFRDAGDLPTTSGARLASGLLYRSGSLHELTEDGTRHLTGLGLRTVIDLRSQTELDVWPDRALGDGVAVLHLPTFPPRQISAEEIREERDNEERDAEAGRESLESLYAFMAETAGPAIARSLSALARPGALPALLHCAVGKDRTGITVATLQSALGVSDAEILDHYFVSNSALGLDQGPVLYLDEYGVERHSRPISRDLLSAFLARVREDHGDARAYVRAHGVTDAELTTLETAFLRTA
ncbi:tyrosine-protein phosphatase [Streptacidiphilus fuscans]|uniref:Tyrosine-protein phosphatase n=1 Tax=Streptacidiphilus fuscans TaxID=2789292 RepID=A0A931BCW1_9ACTN|nr:tyrosine-protein phosphatase [Streptacidiphilus fuscans]MBF9073246.1 tyrosine-protein phosphatase [Streptacidiphilus fuscans]